MLCFSSRSLSRKLAIIYAYCLLQLYLTTLFLPMSLNSLDLAGVRLLSPRDSQILQTVAGADDTNVGDATELKWELDEDRVRCFVYFLDDQ